MDLIGMFRPLLLGTLLLWGCAGTVTTPDRADIEKLPILAGVINGRVELGAEIYMPADVRVPAGSVLVLRPGTTVYVQTAESTKMDPEYLSSATELLVQGALRIEGTARRPVRFVPVAAEGDAPGWSGITLVKAAESFIAGAIIEKAESGVLCIGSSPLIRDSVFSGCRYGIIAQKGSDPQILDNRLENGDAGIFCWLGSSPRIAGNRVVGNAEEGIFVDASSRPVIARNEVTGNALGLGIFSADLSYDASGITGNGENTRILGANKEDQP